MYVYKVILERHITEKYAGKNCLIWQNYNLQNLLKVDN